MNSDLIHRAATFLKLDGEQSASEMLELLLDFRKRLHPDRFQKPDDCKEAEEKFKEAGELIEQIRKAEQLDPSNKQLARYDHARNEVVALKLEIDSLRERVKRAESERDYFRDDYLEKQELRQREERKRREQEFADLMLLYKPNRRHLLGASISAVLALTLTSVTRIDRIADTIRSNSPLEPLCLNWIFFGITLIFLVSAALGWLDNALLRRAIQDINTTEGIAALLESQSGNVTTLNENEVVSFVRGELGRRHPMLCRVASFLSLRTFSPSGIEAIKDGLIYTLLLRKLVDDAKVGQLTRTFVILTSKESLF